MEKGNTKASATMTLNGVDLTFDSSSGDLLAVKTNVDELLLEAGYFDFGIEIPEYVETNGIRYAGAYTRNSFGFFNMDYEEQGRRALKAYELPYGYEYIPDNKINPTDTSISQDADSIRVTYTMSVAGRALGVETVYTVNDLGNVEVKSIITNNGSETVTVNGAAYVLSNMEFVESSLVEIPGNTVFDVYSIINLPVNYDIRTSAIASSMVHYMEDEMHTNILFVNTIERWITGLHKMENDSSRLTQLNLSCTIGRIDPGSTMEIGVLYIQVVGASDPYQAARDLYTLKGWIAPTDGAKGEPIYACHPAGPSDWDFTNPDGSKTLEEYTSHLPTIAGMGFPNVWLLPMFEHPNWPSSIYLPYNQEYIDNRYSQSGDGNASFTAFVAEGSRLGLNTMLDYVPHGPYLFYPEQGNTEIFDNPWMTPERWTWVGTDRDGELGVDWDCWALDFPNPDYLAYTYELAKKQAQDFGIIGARIDACVGSVNNWTPSGDYRFSHSGLYGGTAMSKVIRDGIRDAGKTPLIYPEISWPLPYLAPVSDLQYDFPFYRTTLELRRRNASELEFAAVLAHWLNVEERSTALGVQIGRFLGNADTVSNWYPGTFDNARPVVVYGPEKVRAMWVLLASIDGSFVIYQNDEFDNIEFFTDLLAMRKAHLGPDYAIQYYNDATSGIIAFRRFNDDGQKLVLINLTGEVASRDFSNIDVGKIKFSTAQQTVVYGASGDYSINGDVITLQPYKSVVIELVGGDYFDSPNTAPPFIIRDVSQDIYLDIDKPEFNIPTVPPGPKVYDPYEEFSTETSDGPIWKYMYLMSGTRDLQLCTAIGEDTLNVWRTSRDEYGNIVNWAGAGVSTNAGSSGWPIKPFELNTDGAYCFGFLVFLAAETGIYTIPQFRVVDVDYSPNTKFLILKNGVMTYESDIIVNNVINVPDQLFELEAGDVLMFYIARTDWGYTYLQISNMQIEYTPGYTRYDDSDPLIRYTGPWSVGNSPNYYMGGQHNLYQADGGASFTFEGTAFAIIGSQDYRRGHLDVIVDGELIGTCDFDAPGGYYPSQQVVFQSPEFTEGVHNVSLVSYGSSQGGMARLDALDIKGRLISGYVRYDDADPRINYTGPWTVGNSPNYYMEGQHNLLQADGEATFRFEGTAFAIIGSQDYRKGHLDVIVDGELIGTCNFDAPGGYYPSQQVVFQSPGFTAGVHSVRLVSYGSSQGGMARLDALDINGNLLDA